VGIRWYDIPVELLVVIMVGMGSIHCIGTEELKSIVPNHFNGIYDVSSYRYSELARYVDFGESIQTALYGNPFPSKGMQIILRYFKFMYEKNNFLNVVPQNQVKIPMILHFIWFGNRLLSKFLSNLASWKRYYPGWIFIYWGR